MKKILSFVTLLFVSYCFSQSIKEYKAVIIPLKFDFQKEQNQFRLQTLIKINLQKNGFQAFYSNEYIPSEINDRCKLLTVDLIKESSFLITKLIVVFKDCYGIEIYKSEAGKSREKDFELAYKEALENAFKTLNNSITNSNSTDNSKIISENTLLELKSPTPIQQNQVSEKENILLYAQPTIYGFQLIDSTPLVIMRVYKTSNSSVFIATKENVQGVLIAKENHWFFEYYQNDQLISEKINVKF